MNVAIEYEVTATDLPEAIRRAREMLVTFIGPDDDPEAYQITLRCEPDIRTGDGSTIAWKCDVSAVRGIRYGKGAR